ncbi:MBL fold metallo-hydrolase [Candidatus Phycosocius spiralis]|uniref:MBL fold metallo-hydrolase n=1 Tax=Candidatus Phycosocius spiralis TaxID=2815099 RepID=A0ABQ4PV31_9PROT|nr:MBL fold metallo-hydrolase [Candidatus Phycosocius spiralis]GIU66877.1 MBL fold metallo-hydrolase [Candidatus Phycosocius spiralis]
MAVSIPFVRDIKFDYGIVEQVSPLIRRVIANNPGPFTFTGTGVYIIGHGDVCVLDPGPDMTDHFDALKSILHGETVSHVLVTHSHMDHSPLAHPLARWAGCSVFASGAIELPSQSEVQLEAGDDSGFRPDTIIHDGSLIEGNGWSMEAISTPGHTSGHMCYALREENCLFSGDHIMGWSTTVISPPDGDMDDYLNSLEKIAARQFTTIWPTHGPPIREPAPFIAAYRKHRLDREAQILACLEAGHARIRDIVPIIYATIDQNLWPAASHSVLAHVSRLIKIGKVRCEGEPAIDTHLRLV